ncbi:MAG: GntR family transcriptional regulator [Lachnospiraceae bacterium]|nr:GntR family transcriptional regulator [Lachnospiraceae bacterium]
MKTALQSDGAGTLYEQVVNLIKDAILKGEFQKGDLLPSENELQQKTGVSRITIRRALNILSDTGVIETRKGKGSYVLVDASDFRHSDKELAQRKAYEKYFMDSTRARLLIEPEIAREAADKASRKDLERIEETLPRHGKIFSAENHNNFHIALARATGNPVITEIMEKLVLEENRNASEKGSGIRFVPPDLQSSVSEELDRQHRQIYECVKEHNSEFAYFHMKEHLCYLMKAYEDYFDWFLQ